MIPVLRRWFCLLAALLLFLSCALGEETPAEELPVYPPMEYDLDIPGKRVYDTYVSDTLRFTIETFHMEGNKCVLTEVWVQDPGRQIRKVNADWGKDLANPKDLARKLPETVLATNASGYVTRTYPDIPASYPGKPADYYFTTLGSLVITDGKILRELDGVPFYGLALTGEGISMYRGADNADVLAASPSQTWAFFESCAMQENGADLLPEEGTWPMAKEKHARTLLARVNRNNYLLLHLPYGPALRGMSLYRLNQFFSEHFETEWVYNLDGGYSTSLVYRQQKKKSALFLLVPNVQKIADLLCFTE